MKTHVYIKNSHYLIVAKELNLFSFYLSRNELNFILNFKLEKNDLDKIHEVSYKILFDLLSLIPFNSFKLYIVYDEDSKTNFLFFQYKSLKNYEVYPTKLYENIFNILFETIRPTRNEFKIAMPSINTHIDEISYNISLYRDGLLTFKIDNQEYFFISKNKNNTKKIIDMKDFKIFSISINNIYKYIKLNNKKEETKLYTLWFNSFKIEVALIEEIESIKTDINYFLNNMNIVKDNVFKSGALSGTVSYVIEQ